VTRLTDYGWVKHGWVKQQAKRYSLESHKEMQEVLNDPVQRERVDIALKWMGSEKLVLDIGAGPGDISEEIRKQNNAVVSLDLPQIIRQARDFPDLTLIAADANYPPFRDKTFDIVYSGQLIEHILDVKHFLNEVRRILKDDGKLVIDCPNTARLRNRIGLLLGYVTSWHEWNKEPEHIRYWTHQTLLECLMQNGFQPLEIRGAKSRGGIVYWDIFTEEERRVLKRIMARFTPSPIFLLSYICVLARKR